MHVVRGVVSPDLAGWLLCLTSEWLFRRWACCPGSTAALSVPGACLSALQLSTCRVLAWAIPSTHLQLHESSRTM